MARFVDVFARVLGDPKLPHLFFIEGGALAVENALKVAFDWKSPVERGARPRPAARHARCMHLREAFHGRSGYTLSLTNTDPVKVDRFPQVRVAADPVAVPVPRSRRRGAREGGACRGPRRVRAAPARHRVLRHGADPGRGRRPPLPAAVPAGDAGAVPRVRRAVRRGRGADRLRPDRHGVGLPAARHRSPTSSPSARRPRSAA